jgi:RHS repeat-associated protein
VTIHETASLCAGDARRIASTVRRERSGGDAGAYDTTVAATEALDTGTPLVPPSIVGDANPFYGRVVYGPGLALDQPLSVTRYEYRDNPYGGAPAQVWPTYTLVPFWDYRGTPAFGVFSDGATWKPYRSGGTTCAPLGTGTTDRCVALTWPFAGSAYHQDRGLVLTFSWQGILLLKKQDASGLTYQRNRMYDPATGRFTQEDPIGLAGGLNAYGFAGGDPVNYSDPFGLYIKPITDPRIRALIAQMLQSPTFRKIWLAMALAPRSEATFSFGLTDFQGMLRFSNGTNGTGQTNCGYKWCISMINAERLNVNTLADEFTHAASGASVKVARAAQVPVFCAGHGLGAEEICEQIRAKIEKETEAAQKKP